jgi:hypothetical protein
MIVLNWASKCDELRETSAFCEQPCEIDAPTHKRNGGRHCCQPPLRRAKDLPVFVTWLIEPFQAYPPVLDPGSPAQASLSILLSLLRGARLVYWTTWPESSLVLRRVVPGFFQNHGSRGTLVSSKA